MTSSQYSPEAYRLLLTDKAGQRLPFTDIVAEGLEPGYEDRIPGLLELATNGTAYERLLSICMLASWAQPTGLLQIIEWAGDPQGTPWADDPVVVDGLTGADRAFDMMGDALQVSYYVEDASIADLRDQAVDGLLRIYHRFVFRDGLALALHKSGPALVRHAAAIHGAIHASLDRAEHPEGVEFNLPLQVVLLMLPLRTLGDDRSVAEYANRLMRLPDVQFNALRELAAELGAAHGPETLASLRQLASLGRNEEIEPYLTRAFERRRATL